MLKFHAILSSTLVTSNGVQHAQVKLKFYPLALLYFAVKHFIVGFYETLKKLMRACAIGEKFSFVACFLASRKRLKYP